MKRLLLVFLCAFLAIAIGATAHWWFELGNPKGIYGDERDQRVNIEFIAEKEAMLLGGNAFVTQGHTVNQLAYSPDGTLLASVASVFVGNVRPGIQVWNAETGEDIGLAVLKDRDINSLAWSSKRNHFVICDRQGNVEIWDADGGNRLRSLGTNGKEVTCVAWSQDGKWIAAGQEEGTTYLWSTADWKRRDLEQPSRCVAFLPNSHSLVAALKSKIYVLPLQENSQSRAVSLNDESLSIRALAISPDSKYAVVCTGGRLKSIDVATGKQMCSMTGKSMFRLAFHPDGTKLVVTSFGGDGRLLDFEDDGQFYRKNEIDGDGWSATFSPDGEKIALSTRRISFADGESGKTAPHYKSHSAMIRSAFFIDEGKTLLTCDSYDYFGKWTVGDGKLTSLEKLPYRMQSMLDCSPDGETVVSTSEFNEVVLWEHNAEFETQVFRNNGLPVLSAAISPTGKHVGALTIDGTLTLWDSTSKPPLPLHRWEYKPQRHLLLGHVAFTPDGKLLAALYPGQEVIRVHNVESETVRCEIAGGSLFQSTFDLSPDNRHVAYSSESKIVVSELQSGLRVKAMQGELNYVANATYSADGKLLAAAGTYPDTFSPVVRIWSAKTGEVLLDLRGHYGRVSSLEFSPNGDSLISVSQDSTILYWDIRRAKEKLW